MNAQNRILAESCSLEQRLGTGSASRRFPNALHAVPRSRGTDERAEYGVAGAISLAAIAAACALAQQRACLLQPRHRDRVLSGAGG